MKKILLVLTLITNFLFAQDNKEPVISRTTKILKEHKVKLILIAGTFCILGALSVIYMHKKYKTKNNQGICKTSPLFWRAGILL